MVVLTGLTTRFFEISGLSLLLLISGLSIPGAETPRFTGLGPGGGGFFLDCVVDPNDPQIVYLTSDVAGIFRSLDQGLSWTSINIGISGDHSAGAFGIEQLEIHPLDHRILFAASWEGLYRSSDSGESWQELMSGEPIARVTIDQENSQHLWAGVGTPSGNEDGAGIVYRSVDDGLSWSERQLPSPTAVVHGIVVDPDSPLSSRHLLVATDTGLFLSTNDGVNFVDSQTSGLPGGEGRELVGGRSSSGEFVLYHLVQTSAPTGETEAVNRLYRSVNFGATWIGASGDLPPGPFTTLAVAPADADRVYLGNWLWEEDVEIGMWRSTDRGESWRPLAEDGDSNLEAGWLKDWWGREGASFLCVSPPFLAFGENSFYRSTDNGSTWAATYTTKHSSGHWSTTGLDPTYSYTMAFDPSDSGVVYVGYEDIGLWKSSDGGLSFRSSADLIGGIRGDYDAVSSILVDPKRPSRVWADLAPSGMAPDINYQQAEGMLIRSTDSGFTWQQVGATSLPGGPCRLVLDPSSPIDTRTLFAAVYLRGVYTSVDDGQTWEDRSTGLDSDRNNVWRLAIDPFSPSRLFVGTNRFSEDGGDQGALYRSTDGASSWHRLPNLPAGDVMAIAIDPHREGALFVGVAFVDWLDGAVYESTNAGNTWREILRVPHPFAIAVHKSRPGVLWASSSQWWNLPPAPGRGLWQSTDGGSSWSNISGHLANAYIHEIIPNPHDPDMIFVATHGNGLFRADLNQPSDRPPPRRPAGRVGTGVRPTPTPTP